MKHKKLAGIIPNPSRLLVLIAGIAILALVWSTKIKPVLKLFLGVVAFGLVLANSQTIIPQLKNAWRQT